MTLFGIARLKLKSLLCESFLKELPYYIFFILFFEHVKFFCHTVQCYLSQRIYFFMHYASSQVHNLEKDRGYLLNTTNAYC